MYITNSDACKDRLARNIVPQKCIDVMQNAHSDVHRQHTYTYTYTGALAHAPTQRTTVSAGQLTYA